MIKANTVKAFKSFSAHYVRDVGVAGSNPVIPTSEGYLLEWVAFIIFLKRLISKHFRRLQAHNSPADVPP